MKHLLMSFALVAGCGFTTPAEAGDVRCTRWQRVHDEIQCTRWQVREPPAPKPAPTAKDCKTDSALFGLIRWTWCGL